MHLKIPLMLGTLFFVILLLPEKGGTPRDNLQMIVFSDKSKELDQSDNQIYSTANYSPILNITWPREREPVVEGVLESNLLPWFHHPFCKFYELVIGSSINDSFNSKVDHLGLKKTLLVHWESSALIQILEATEILVYALGVIMLLWNFILIIMFFKRSMFSTRVPMP
ncbi:RLA class II histocompatibility antigen, DP alpha-1 chain-like isoform X1 [Ornithorhynchus anatinus]|uniref:RLA class II histocompatibility antigen, DP alpha-1 chain-like isoform X1 n=1 Tax=Ornithorhynchus anatinus TaxID=9258 RepID=UPI00045458AC|nr:RLA class II histocompatibility antigen, DP alpha-1 chain-like isoform X1 [Ornithorhynchus anatinus]XP_007657118.1 RLA class II histocompatibility antigen, DP alpha-1 chain-like isoform X1 [Ornithorhynchus anatinus]XP_007657120.1 RLA class II histocompatibility antigen, DP alpha-1 chain-like isoform X1 [Ornithorhynchus anatinus]